MEPKPVMYISFPCDGTGIHVEKILPFPKHYLESELFKKSCIETIVFDFSETDYIDSLALTYVINLSRAVHAAGKEYVFCGMNEQIVKIIRLTKLGNLFKKEDESLDDFLDSCTYECKEYNESEQFFTYIKKMSENMDY